jgi:hypothetical protein
VLPPTSLKSLDPVRCSLEGTQSCVSKHPFGNFVAYQSLSPFLLSFPTFLVGLSLRQLKDALSNPGWRHTMEVEMDALHQNATWELAPLPPGKEIVGCKWVYSVKFNPNRSLDWLRACLVAKDYT